MHLQFEERSMNAWPALQTILYDGWVLRFSNGYTRRANSINPLYPSTIDLHTKMDYCEGLYFSKDLPVIYKLTDMASPAPLDEHLEKRGYLKEYETSLRLLNLSDFQTSITYENIEKSSYFSSQWIDAFISCSDPTAASSKETMAQMLGNILGEKICVQLKWANESVACGFGVIENGFVGLFDIIVKEDCRGKGYGKTIMSALLNEAKRLGAQKAYLQVLIGNSVAENLYESLGFKELYRYWYRIKYAR
jgi:GNAT superfamily N-acetyltransferase